MPGRTVVTVLTGLGFGITMTLADTSGIPDDGVGRLLLLFGLRLFPGMLISVITMSALKRWLHIHEERNRDELTRLGDLNRRLEDDHERRLGELAAREAWVNRSAQNNQAQLASLAQRLDDALATNKEETRLRGQLQTEYDELAADHNLLIQRTLQERADQFSRGSQAPAHRATPSTVGAPAIRLRRLGAPAPAEAREHSRAADGVGDAG